MQAPAAVSATENALISSTTHENRDHNVLSFLQRAYSIANFTWAKTSATGDVLATFRFPDILLSQPALSAKTRNFFGLRAGVELLVLINKQQFQAGNLLISYLPNARYNSAKAAMAQTSLQTRTGMPRTNLDLMDATRATLRVPYASPFIYYNLLTGDGTIGDFYISVYSPLSDVADAGTVSVQVFARFIDVDLEFPTGSTPVSFTKTHGIDNLIEEFRVKPNFDSLKQLIREGNSVLKTIKDGDFRFQMNSENNRTQNMKLRALPNMAVSSDTNNAHIMSLFSSNVLPSTDMGQTSSSEMNINSVLQIPCYHDRFPISNQASGVNVWSKLVQPQTAITPNADGSLDVDYIHFHSEPFSKWRGSIIYHFRVVKTTFHSLRVRVWFSPASLITDTIDRNAVYSKIIDLKDTNHFTFEVPYIWPHPFLNVHVNPTSLGTIGVDIVNQMVFPATVDSSINVIVERSAGTDFCLNLPTVVRSYPFNPVVIPETTRAHHTARRVLSEPLAAGVSRKVSAVHDVNTVVIPNVALTISELNKLQSLPSNMRSQLRRMIDNNPDSESLAHATALDLLATKKDLETSDLYKTVAELIEAFNAFISDDNRYGHHIELRSIREGMSITRKKRHLEHSHVRDLTREGVESNPGPVRGASFNINSAVFNFHDFGTVAAGTLTFNINCRGSTSTTSFNSSGVNDIAIINQGEIDSQNFYTVAVLPGPLLINYSRTAGTGSQLVTLIYTPTASSNGDVTIVGPLPLPTIGEGGGGIVATTSVMPFSSLDGLPHFKFQMNAEQDSLRGGYDDLTFHRPVQSVRADNLSLGHKISDVRDMIKRSSLLGTLPSPTTNGNFITIIPHMIGSVQKDTDGLIHQNACDLISYYASSYAFARGGINLRIITAPDYYWNTVLDPDSTFFVPAASVGAVAQVATAPTPSQIFQLNNPLQQIVKPSLEGFGEVSVPFYSDTFMYSINPTQISEPAVDNQQLQLPYSQLVLQPNGVYTVFQVFRAACSDFEFSYLTGPPKLYPVAT